MSIGLGGTVTSVPGELGFVVVVISVNVDVDGSVGGEVVGLMSLLPASTALHFVFSAQSQ